MSTNTGTTTGTAQNGVARDASIAHLSPYARYMSDVKVPHMFWKRAIDIVVAGLALLVLLPVMLLIALLIRLESPGPVIFKQIRIGRYGKPFIFYKFRSMRENAQELKPLLEHMNEVNGATFKIKHDPRITKVGRFIRKYSLDELPQLFNVLKGDMSLVGPRPLTPCDINRFELAYFQRLAVPPGCTGLWQVSGRSNVGFDEWMRLDQTYVDNISLSLDIKILLKTIPAVLKGDGAY